MVKKERGFTLVELLVVICIASLMLTLAAFNYKKLENPVQNSAQSLMGFMKKTRAKALASTLAYTIRPINSTTIITTSGTSCSSTPQTNDTTLVFNLDAGSHLTDLTWSICYGTRGLSNSSADIVVTDGTKSRTVQVVLGGGVQVI